MEPLLELVQVENALGRGVRHETLMGRQYLVASVTMLVPGVLNGSGGALLYRAERISPTTSAWNGVPLVKGHPFKDGKPVSARSPAVLREYGIGFVFHSMFDGALKGEAWFDVELTRNKDPRILALLESGKPLEVSTGLYLSTVKVEDGSVHNGKPYNFDTTDHRPDHLAILMDQRGACSNDDGCGINNAADEAKVEEYLNREFSAETRREMADKGMAMPDGSFPIATKEDLENAIMAMGRAKNRAAAKRHIIKRARAMGMTSMLPESWQVNNSDIDPAINEGDMDKTQHIQWLTTNCECWKNRVETLNKLSDEEVKGLYDSANTSHKKQAALNSELETSKGLLSAVANSLGVQSLPSVTDIPNLIKAKTVVANSPAPTPALDDAPKNLADALKKYGTPEDQAVWSTAQRISTNERNRLLDKIVNTLGRTDEGKAQLRALYGKQKTEDLEIVANHLPEPQQPVVDAVPRYLPDPGNPSRPGLEINQDDALVPTCFIMD